MCKVSNLIITILCLSSCLSATLIGKFEGKNDICGHDYAVPNLSLSRRLELISKFIPKDPVIFEAGAHNGEHTKTFAQFWREGRIVGFEANTDAYNKAIEFTDGLTNCEIYNLAVNNYNGYADFYVCYGSSGTEPVFDGASSLLEPSDWMAHNYRGPVVRVPCVVVDDWITQNCHPWFDFAWLDLEGAELQVLSSSPNFLNNLKVIYTETNFRKFRKGMSQFDELYKLLTDNDFILVGHWYSEDAGGKFQGDALFVRNELIK